MSVLIATLRALVLVGSVVAGQTSDDWDYETAPGRAMASTAYAEGVMLFVACSNGAFIVGVRGLPASAQQAGTFIRTRADGRTESSYWDTSKAGGVLVSSNPGRIARSFRSGGRLILNSAPEDEGAPVHIALDLPSQSANLDRVMTECGRALESPLDDALVLTGDNLQAIPWIMPPPEGGRARYRIELECLVTNQRLASCRIENQAPANVALGAAYLRQANGRRIRVRDAAAAEGRSLHMLIEGGSGRRR